MENIDVENKINSVFDIKKYLKIKGNYKNIISSSKCENFDYEHYTIVYIMTNQRDKDNKQIFLYDYIFKG